MYVSSENGSNSIAAYQVDQVSGSDYSESQALETFLDYIKTDLDDKIGRPVFRPLWKAILKEVDVESCTKEEEGTYRITLKNGYEIPRSDGGGTTYILEKELLIKTDPENCCFIFPKVLDFKNSGADIDVNNMNLNAIWGYDYHLDSRYTGVGYKTTWDPNNEQFIIDNINDAGWFFQWLATPQKKYISDSLQDWNERPRKVM